MDANKITEPLAEGETAENPQNPETQEKPESKKEKELSLEDLEKVAGGSMRDTIRTETEDITDNIKNRI